MAEAKTQPTEVPPEDFLAGVRNAKRRADGTALLDLMREVTAVDAVMWGPSIIGFGVYDYHYATGRTGRWPAVGFSPRAAALTIYLTDGAARRPELLARLGPHTVGGSCLYIKSLADIDLDVLRTVIAESFAVMNGATVTTE